MTKKRKEDGDLSPEVADEGVWVAAWVWVANVDEDIT